MPALIFKNAAGVLSDNMVAHLVLLDLSSLLGDLALNITHMGDSNIFYIDYYKSSTQRYG